MSEDATEVQVKHDLQGRRQQQENTPRCPHRSTCPAAIAEGARDEVTRNVVVVVAARFHRFVNAPGRPCAP